MLGHPKEHNYPALVARELSIERHGGTRYLLGPSVFRRWPNIASGPTNLADSRTRPTHLCARSHRIYLRRTCYRQPCSMEFAAEFSNVSLELYPGSWGEFAFLRGECVALAVIPVMLLLANIGRRLMKLRIAGMVAEINLARTPDSIQTALRRALDDPSLVIHLWSPEQEQYVDTDGRSLDDENSARRLMVDILDPDGSASARIVADESVAHHPELLRAAREAGGMALHNSALQASLMATIERERSSRELSETCRTSCRLVWPTAYVMTVSGLVNLKWSK
jgi:hypothetical protein